MSRVLLLPLNRFSVRYEVGSGRPHSQLEQFMLQAIGDGAATVASLEHIFLIHPRLITQAVVNLIQDGYVAIGASAYVLTREGGDVIRDGATRRESVIVRSTTVIMERRLGLLAPSREVRFVGRRELDELQDRKRVVPSVQHGIRLDEAQVRHLLLRGPTQWIRSVADIRLIGREGHWLPVRVDPASETVTGMPDRWQPYLSGPLIDYARTLSPADITADEDAVEAWL